MAEQYTKTSEFFKGGNHFNRKNFQKEIFKDFPFKIWFRMAGKLQFLPLLWVIFLKGGFKVYSDVPSRFSKSKDSFTVAILRLRWVCGGRSVWQRTWIFTCQSLSYLAIYRCHCSFLKSILHCKMGKKSSTLHQHQLLVCQSAWLGIAFRTSRLQLDLASKFSWQKRTVLPFLKSVIKSWHKCLNFNCFSFSKLSGVECNWA